MVEKREYKTAEEVKKRAEEAIGHPFSEIRQLASEFRGESFVTKRKGKGEIGQTFEEGWFHYAANSDMNPDFEEADVELKVTGYLYNSRGYRVKERLSLNQINYKLENWYEYKESRFWKKNHHLLIMYYQYFADKNSNKFSVQKVDEILLEELPKKDREIIQHDWEKIAAAVRLGRANKLTERDFMYLSPATKGKNGKETVEYASYYPTAKRRAYSFKKSYMTQLFNGRMLNAEEAVSVVPEGVSLSDTEFDDVLLNVLKPYFGRTVKSLKEEFGVDNQGYSVKNEIIRAIFKTTCDLEETDEFKKANYRFRTVTVNSEGTPLQDISFPVFDFNDLMHSPWESSVVFEEMVEPKFLLAIFSKNAADEDILNNAIIWYVPERDIKKVKEVWREARRVINSGIVLKQTVAHKDGKPVFKYINNFPKSGFNGVAQVRNKASDSEYFKESADSVRLTKPAAVIPAEDIPEELRDVAVPSGEFMTTQCFWFNKGYIGKQIEAHIRKY